MPRALVGGRRCGSRHGFALRGLGIASLFVCALGLASPWALAATESGDKSAAAARRAPGFDSLPAGASVLLMPPDIELYSLSAGAVRQPRADWTAAGLEHFKAALATRNRAQGLATMELGEPEAGRFDEIIQLHTMVAKAIVRHHLGEQRLVGKQLALDWSLGEAVHALRDQTGAHYALFVTLRDSYASAERIALMPLRLVLGGLPYGGLQRGYASLVDLETGRVLWFNRLERNHGDLRDLQSAGETVEALFDHFPAASASAVNARLMSGRNSEAPARPGLQATGSKLTAEAYLSKAGGAISLSSTLAQSLGSPEAGLRYIMDREEARLRRSPFAIGDRKLHDYVQAIVCRLAPEDCANIRVYLERTPIFHASMAPNGALRVWSGLMVRMENEAQFAAVLAHEIAHYLERHGLDKLRAMESRSAVVEALGVFGSIGGYGERALRMELRAHTREQEREADRISVELLRKAGYDGREAAKIWVNLRAELEASGGDPNKRNPLFATHPTAAERQQVLTELAGAPTGGDIHADTWTDMIAPHRQDWLLDEVRLGKTTLIGRHLARE